MKLLLSAALLLVPPVAANATDTPWRQLFNGRDLTGWKIVIRGFDRVSPQALV